MLNWRRGMFRLWAVISILWMAATIGIAYQQESEQRADPVVMHTYEVHTADGRSFEVEAPSMQQAVQSLDEYLKKNETGEHAPYTAAEKNDQIVPSGVIPYQPNAPTPPAIGFWVTAALSLPIASGIVLLLLGWAIGGFSAKKSTYTTSMTA